VHRDSAAAGSPGSTAAAPPPRREGGRQRYRLRSVPMQPASRTRSGRQGRCAGTNTLGDLAGTYIVDAANGGFRPRGHLINNATTTRLGDLADYAESDWDSTLDV